MLSNYVPILGLFALAAGFAIFSVTAAPYVGPRRYNHAKLDAYECGIEPVHQPLSGGRFPVKYYLTAMLFIVFDIEIVFLYPLAVQLRQLALFGFMELLVFVLLLGIGYVYIWRKGALEWK
jgi:NADH-quinone oxidoreductase subunit A